MKQVNAVRPAIVVFGPEQEADNNTGPLHLCSHSLVDHVAISASAVDDDDDPGDENNRLVAPSAAAFAEIMGATRAPALLSSNR